MPPRLPWTPALFAGIILNCSCATAKWPSTQKGSHSVSEMFGVASLYKVDSTIAIANSNFGDPVEVRGDMIGRFGTGLAGEYFAIDDVALFYGLEYRGFDPQLDDPLIEFGQASQTELFLGSRWYLPWGLTPRLRPFVHGKLAYIPRVRFDMTTTLPFDEPLNDGILVAPFSGSAYWSLGLGGGLAYQVADDLLISLSFFYELPLNKSRGRASSDLTQATGNAFLDNILDTFEYDIALDPSGWIGFLNITYIF